MLGDTGHVGRYIYQSDADQKLASRQDAFSPGCLRARMPGCLRARMPGCLRARMPSRQDAFSPGCLLARMPSRQDAFSPGCPGQDASQPKTKTTPAGVEPATAARMDLKTSP
ncbi:unnamed protein product [Polarella glacialis]|uniref:Uncharacterized protein n=1 Tax=Polarella glacialis TaxID=89957 RepID=A0A813EJ62_POLGL|nr:unnamed protein product [Polarella glacialis]